MSESVKPTRKIGAYHHGDLRSAAIEAAVRLLDADDGADHEALSLRAVADALGVTHKALYRHFPDKAGLLDAVAAEAFRQLAAALAQPGRDPAAYCRAYLAFALERRGLYRLMMDAPARRRTKELDQAISAVIETARGVFADDREIKRMWILLHGGVSLQIVGALEQRDDAAFAEFMVDLALGA